MKQDKFNQLEEEMKESFKERNDEIHGLILALLSRENVFLVGSPGTAKSMMIRMLSDTVEEANYFEWLFTKYTTPDEVFGSVKLSKLKQDSYERNIQGKLPTAHFAFIDEIWKANSSILNSLLSIINERIYHNDGKPIDCPLETMMSASNEIPNDREELGAMWDRFLLKYRVKQIQEDKAFKDMLSEKINDFNTTLTLEQIHEAQEEVSKVEIPDEVLKHIIDIRDELRKNGIIPSDRRYKKSMKVIKAQAWLNGRDKAQVDDLMVLCHILWDDVDHITEVRKIITDISNPYMREADELHDAIMDAWRDVQNEPEDSEDRERMASDASLQIKNAIKKLNDLKNKMEQEARSTDRVEKYIQKGKEIREEKILGNILEL